MTDIIVAVWTPEKQRSSIARCVQAVVDHTDDFNLIVVGDSGSMAENVNVGLERATSEYIAVLDDDVFVTEGWLESLTDVLESNPEVGMVGPKMHGTYTGLNAQIEDGYVGEWPTLAGGCVLFRNIGLKWDERFVGSQWADTDWCKQYKHAGYKVFADGRVSVEHNQLARNVRHDINEPLYIEKWGSKDL